MRENNRKGFTRIRGRFGRWQRSKECEWGSSLKKQCEKEWIDWIKESKGWNENEMTVWKSSVKSEKRRK